MEVKLKLKWLLLMGVVFSQRHRENGVINIPRGGKIGPDSTRQRATKERNKYRPDLLDQQSSFQGLSSDDLSIVNSILQATLAAEKPTAASPIDEPKVILGLRSGFQDIVDTIDIEKSKGKDKQNQMCVELSEAMSTNLALDKSLRNYGFVASCNKQNYKNSGCYVKCQKGYQLNAKRPLVTCRCRKRKGGEGNGEVTCKWDGLAEMQCLSTSASAISRNGVRETCDRPTNQGVFTILDTWNTGLMSMISTAVNTNVTDWTLLLEWNKPLKSRKSYLWNAKLDSVSKDLTLWTIMNKAKSGRDETDLSKIEFGMVIDKIEQRDYDIRDLTANVYFWNYHYTNASCWAADINSKKSLLSSHIEEITRTRMGIQPAKETEKFCYYGKYENSNVWKHSGSQYRVHGHVEFDLPVALGEWEVQLVFDDDRKMVIMETPQMIKNDRSTDGQYWAFRAQEYNQVLFSKSVKFFVQGAMWRTAPGPRSTRTLGSSIGGFFGGIGLESNTYNPHDNEWRNDPSGAVRICGIEADWAAQETQRSQLFSAPKYTGQCAQQDEVISYDFVDGERCQEWSPKSITTISKANIRRWNRSSGCEKLPEDKRLICLSILYIDGQRAGLNSTNIPYRSEASTLKDGCEVTDKMGAPLPRDLSGGFFADDGHLKITKVTAHMVTLLAWSIASNRESWQEKGLTEWALGTLRHGVDYLAEARISATDIVVQVGDARTDATCDLSVELLDEFRPVLTSSRKYPASDTMGSFVAAIYAAAHAFSVLGDRSEARQCATKGKQSLDSLIRGPKGLTGRNPEYETGQMGSEWFGDCYQDELAWASAWACLGSSGLEICLTKVDSLLEEADEKCEQVKFENQWSWNDVRLGTRLLLAQYSKETTHLNKFVKEMNKIIQVGIKKLCQDGFERATALANLFAMSIQLENLDDESRETFTKFTSKLLTCTSRNIIGIRPGSASLETNHKNANYYGAVLWGGTKNSKLLNSVNLLLSAVVAN